jgi:DNA-binding LacI/PurR family transcriptional regulator
MITSILKKDLIYSQLRDKIMSGELTGMLPRESVFAKELEVGKVTLRAALSRLQEESLVIRVNGRGTFVLSQDERKQRKKTILLVTTDTQDMSSPSQYIVPEVFQYAMQKGVRTECISYERLNVFSVEELNKYICRCNVCGILFFASSFTGNEPVITLLNTLGIPVVLPHARPGDNEVTGFATMFTDHALVMDAAIKYLVGLGHKKIAFIGNSYSHLPYRTNSFRQLSEIFEKYKCITLPEYFPLASYHDKNIEEKIYNILLLNNAPSAIILFSDFFAVYAYRAIKKAGKTIPGDISVLGLCGYPDADMVTPHLNTVDFQYSLIAQQAVDLLLNSGEWFRLDKKGPVINTDFKIVKRESVKIMNNSFINKEVKKRKPDLIHI